MKLTEIILTFPNKKAKGYTQGVQKWFDVFFNKCLLRQVSPDWNEILVRISHHVPLCVNTFSSSVFPLSTSVGRVVVVVFRPMMTSCSSSERLTKSFQIYSQTLKTIINWRVSVIIVINLHTSFYSHLVSTAIHPPMHSKSHSVPTWGPSRPLLVATSFLENLKEAICWRILHNHNGKELWAYIISKIIKLFIIPGILPSSQLEELMISDTFINNNIY